MKTGTWQGYLLIDLSQMTEPERTATLTALQQLSACDHPQPSRRSHGRLSQDGSTLLVEGLFEEAEIAMLSEQLTVTQLGEAGSSYAESHAAALAYLREHRAAWEAI